MAKKQIWDEKLNKDCSLKSNFLFHFSNYHIFFPNDGLLKLFHVNVVFIENKTAKPKYAKSYQWGGYHSITLSCSSSFAFGTTCKFCSIAVPLFYCGHTTLLSGGIYMERRGKCYDFLFSLPFSSQMLSGGT